MKMEAPLRVHWVRHGKVASHRGDTSLTDEGRRQVEVVGEQFSRELVSGEVAEQLPPSCLSLEQIAQLPFLPGFWGTPDRIGYWVNPPNPPGEDADAVARRLLTFAVSLLDLPRVRPRRYICVTHSPPMRAFLRRYLLGYDPGEPAYAESVDMDFDGDGLLTIRYRGDLRKMAL
jgi:broad specificity phosphatase PhoE